MSVGLLLLAAGMAMALYACLIEPRWLEVTRHEVAAPVARPLTIAHLSDLHTQGLGPLERRVIAVLERERPDVIVLTGDYLPTGGRGQGALEVLRRLHAPLGVWAVKGNHDGSEEVRLVRDGGVRMLVNEAVQLRDEVWLVGLDNAVAGSPDADAALAGLPEGAFAIALFHFPTALPTVSAQVQLALAGHTHGGQIRIPGLTRLWLPPGSGKFAQGWHQENRCQMYVSRGLGTSLLPVRFRCRPELALLTLTPDGAVLPRV